MLRPQRVSSQWRTNPTLESFAQPLRLTERSKEQLENLWRVLNKKKDDRIDYDDFVGLAKGNHEVARRRWQEMSTHFDSDRNGHITPIEFIEGFKALGLRRPLDLEGSFRSMPRTHAEFQRALNDSINRELQNLLLKVYTDLASNEPMPNPGPPSSIWRTDAHLEVIGQSTGQWLFVGTENKLLIEQIFGALDANKDGNINVNDFRPAAERPARSELWDVLRTHFDGDSNGVISLDEFVDLFKKRALTLSCVPIRSGERAAIAALAVAGLRVAVGIPTQYTLPAPTPALTPSMPPALFTAPTDHSKAMEYLNESINRQLNRELSKFQRRVGPPHAPAAAFDWLTVDPSGLAPAVTVSSYVSSSAYERAALVSPPAPPARSRRKIVVIIDGMNVGRNPGAMDPEYENPAHPKRVAFDEVRARDAHSCAGAPPLLALGIVAALEQILKANDTDEARAAGVEYVPMAFLVQWVRGGGRTGSLKAFNAERLDAWQQYITFTPPRRDDDDAQIAWAKAQLRLGHECYVITNDNWDDHKRSGKITHEWFMQHVVPYMWVGRSGLLLLTPPDGVRLPGLCDIDEKRGIVLGVHHDFHCDRSGMSPIVGTRYHWRDHDYDLCEAEWLKLPAAERAYYDAIAPPLN